MRVCPVLSNGVVRSFVGAAVADVEILRSEFK